MEDFKREHSLAPENSAEESVATEQGVLERKVLEKPTEDLQVLTERKNKIVAIREKLNRLKGNQEAENESLDATRARLGIPERNTRDNLQEQNETRRVLLELVEAEANYPGDWTLVLQERLVHPSTDEKIRALYDKYKEFFLDKRQSLLDKGEKLRSFQETYANTLADRVENAFGYTKIGPAKQFGKSPIYLGGVRRGGSNSPNERFEDPGALFSDAVTPEGVSLNARQKNIIEAHEKGHAVREFVGPIGENLSSALDADVINNNAKKPGYSSHPDEIAERMAQLKNYFGFSDDEIFTREHLQHARENYCADTGLDNDMTTFFKAITPERESKFLQIINSYPI